MEIPSLLLLSLCQLAKTREFGFGCMMVPDDSLKVYPSIYDVITTMVFCPHCNHWTSPFSSAGIGYHFIVYHSNLLAKECRCGDCVININLTKTPRSILCLRCKRGYHYRGLNAGHLCHTKRLRNLENFNTIYADTYSDYHGYTYNTTPRTPTCILDWMSQDYPLGGHSLCDWCLRDMVVTGELRRQYSCPEIHYVPAYCDLCGFSISSREPWSYSKQIRTIVLKHKKKLNLVRSSPCLDCMFMSTWYTMPDLNLTESSLICDSCFASLSGLTIQANIHHRPL
jgi:hypothetical protein